MFYCTYGSIKVCSVSVHACERTGFAATHRDEDNIALPAEVAVYMFVRGLNAQQELVDLQQQDERLILSNL
jgi:hypothetical protein